jgi:hypothetical protein
MQVSAHGFTSTVAKLLTIGVDIAAKDKHGITALALTCVKLGNMDRLSAG